jgi:hypothetical protein
MIKTPAELAAHFRISERTVARLLADGCPSMLVGKRRRFDLGDVTRWMEGRACQQDKTPMDDGTQKLALGADDFTAACRRVQLRVMPSVSPPS